MICWFGLLSGLTTASGLYGVVYRYKKRRDGFFVPSLRFTAAMIVVFFFVWFGVAAARHLNDSFLNVGFFEIPSVLGRCPGTGPVPALAEGFKLTDPLRFTAYSVGFAAGALTLFSPCGFPLLPAYIPYFLGKKPSIGKALVGGGITTAGFATTLMGLGTIIALTTGFLGTNILYSRNFDLVAGGILIAMGLVMALKISLPFLPNIRSTTNKGYGGLFMFGISWSGAALTCSAPLFISTAIFAIALEPSVLVPTFAFYALGMGIPVIVISAVLGVAGQLFVRKLILLAPKLQRGSGVLLLGIGIYVLTYFFTFGQ